ncbi:hypothetical protein RLIN73S_00692 [Rhodanobacter lindaniclasticus]
MRDWSRHRPPLASLLCALILLVVLSSCASTTPRRVEAPRLPPAPPPAECTVAAFEATAPALAPIPGYLASWGGHAGGVARTGAAGAEENRCGELPHVEGAGDSLRPLTARRT